MQPPAPTGLMPQTAGQGQSLHRGLPGSSRRQQHSGWAHEDAQNWGGGCLSKESTVGPAVWQQTCRQGPGPRREASASTRGSDTPHPEGAGHTHRVTFHTRHDPSVSTAGITGPATRCARINGTPGPGVGPPHTAQRPQDLRQQAKPAPGGATASAPGVGSTRHPSGLGCSPKRALLQSSPK